MLGFEVANNVLCHLSGSSIKNSVFEFAEKSDVFNDKEKSVICYLAGYVFSTIYRGIRFSKVKTYLSLLLAGKISEDR